MPACTEQQVYLIQNIHLYNRQPTNQQHQQYLHGVTVKCTRGIIRKWPTAESGRGNVFGAYFAQEMHKNAWYILQDLVYYQSRPPKPIFSWGGRSQPMGVNPPLPGKSNTDCNNIMSAVWYRPFDCTFSSSTLNLFNTGKITCVCNQTTHDHKLLKQY